MAVRDVRGNGGWSLLHIAARLVIVSMQDATLDNVPFKLCAQGYHLQTMISVNFLQKFPIE